MSLLTLAPMDMELLQRSVVLEAHALFNAQSLCLSVQSRAQHQDSAALKVHAHLKTGVSHLACEARNK